MAVDATAGAIHVPAVLSTSRNQGLLLQTFLATKGVD